MEVPQTVLAYLVRCDENAGSQSLAGGLAPTGTKYARTVAVLPKPSLRSSGFPARGQSCKCTVFSGQLSGWQARPARPPQSGIALS